MTDEPIYTFRYYDNLIYYNIKTMYIFGYATAGTSLNTGEDIVNILKLRRRTLRFKINRFAC